MNHYSFKKFLEWREAMAIWDGKGDTVDYQWWGNPWSMGSPNQPKKRRKKKKKK